MARERFVAITIWRVDTGVIDGVCTVRPGSEDAACAEGQAWKPGHIDAAQCRIDPATGEAVPLLTFEPDLSLPNIIGNLPAGAIAWFQNIKVPVEDGSLEIEVTWSEVVRVRLVHPLYFTLPVDVACVPASAPENPKG